MKEEHYECCGQTKMLIHTLWGLPCAVKCFICHKILWIAPQFDRK